MFLRTFHLVAASLWLASLTAAHPNAYHNTTNRGHGYDNDHAGNSPFNLRPFRIKLSHRLPHMRDLIRTTLLPSEPQYPGVGSSQGISLATLKSLQHQWLHSFSWPREQRILNTYNHFTAEIEGLTMHFVHHKSGDSEAIPLLLCHGWPGSFLEFLPLVDELTAVAETSTGKRVTFDVVVPSLPGFTFSDRPPENWTLDDTARVYNTLMTEVLEYPTYAAHGTAHGSPVVFHLYDVFNAAMRAAHFVFMPFYPLSPAEIAEQDIELTELETFQMGRSVEWGVSGNGYFIEHTTKPNTIGLALEDNPIGQLAWVGEKYIDWSDPEAGMEPSILTHNEILKSISLYYLTRTFTSSVYTYAQDPGAFERVTRMAHTDAPMLVSFFKYMVGFWPKEIIETMGNLVSYRNHEFGGNFAGLDNPEALIEDLREIGTFWMD